MSLRGPELTLMLALLLAGCAPAGTAVAPETENGIPDAVTVSTNEPFYSATVQGGAIVLTGVDLDARTLAAREVAAPAGTRRWEGRDAAGAVAVVVTASACTDDMSGAAFPLAGRLEIDGRGARGCGYPAGSPPPRPE